ncbi:MAG: glycosyltransferase family 4 protein [Gammaproteobacteria bacterium]|nr:glycosyltransferase family 4 protein [Gammaproteobacteria bacterium]
MSTKLSSLDLDPRSRYAKGQSDSAAALRILHIVAMDCIRSGGPTQLKRLAIEQVKAGHRVTTVFSKNDKCRNDFRELEEQSVDVRFLHFDEFRLSLRTVRAIWMLRRLIRSGEFDLIHAHKGTALDLLFFAALEIRIPIVANRGMSARLSWRNAFKYRSKRLSRIIAVAENVKEILIETGGVDPDKVVVVYGGVDTEVFQPGVRSTLRAELGISDGVRIIGNLGSLGGRKGIPELLDAFARLHADYDDIVLVMVGATAEQMAHRKYVIPEHVKPYVYLVPFRQDVPNCLAAFDIFVFSGTRNEGLTGAVREAAAMALPIVTTDVGGNRELIKHAKGGLVVPPGDSNALYREITRLLKCPELGKRLGKGARNAVQTKMTNHDRCDKIIQIYRDVIEEYGASRRPPSTLVSST